jgi:hypothetical protein
MYCTTTTYITNFRAYTIPADKQYLKKGHHDGGVLGVIPYPNGMDRCSMPKPWSAAFSVRDPYQYTLVPIDSLRYIPTCRTS